MKPCIFKRILAITALILAVTALIGCGGCKGCAPEQGGDGGEVVVISEEPLASDTPAVTETGLVTPEPTPEITPEPEFVSMRASDGFLRANKNGTYGIGIDGSVRYTGNTNMGHHLIYDWENVVDLETNDTATAALMRDGTIKVCGFMKGAFSAACEWTGAVDIALGDRHIAGLRTDGTVVAVGDDSAGQCRVGEWAEVLKVVAAGNYTAALTEHGVLTTLGEEFDAAVNAAPVADIEAAADHLVLLMADGTVRSVPVGSEGSKGDSSGKTGGKATANEFDWTGIVKVFASKGATFAIDRTGKLFTDSSLIDSEINNAYYVCASEKHAVVLCGDGACKGFGDNDVYQHRVSGWRLLPFVDEDGWLMGYGPGTYIGTEAVRTGIQTTYTDPATGESREATFVILGDVNCDGFITSEDEAAMNAHIAGTQRLTGAALRAANIVVDSSKPSSVDIVDLEKLRLELAGTRAIDRFGKTDQYTALYADAKRKNEDTRGYIKIKDTNISYPIMYDFDWYYNDHDIDGNSTVRGSIYFYWAENNRNIVITGHNSRTSGTMFHQLHKVQDNKSKLTNFKNRIWQINTYGETGYWEVWALYEEPAFKDASQSSQYYNTNFPNTFNSLTEQERRAWIDYQLRKSELGYSVGVTTEDRFMTLLTCGDSHQDSAKGARLYIFLRWVGRN